MNRINVPTVIWIMAMVNFAIGSVNFGQWLGKNAGTFMFCTLVGISILLTQPED